MDRRQLMSLAVMLAVLGTAYAQSSQSGKCKPNLKPISLDGKTIQGKWNILYLTDTERAREVDHSFDEITPIESGTYNVAATKVLKDKTSFTMDSKLTIANNVMLSEFLYNGSVQQYKMYLLNNINDDAILVYHCSDTGAVPVDLRFIQVRDGKTLSEDSLKKLLDTDKSYNFTGDLYKLPNELK